MTLQRRLPLIATGLAVAAAFAAGTTWFVRNSGARPPIHATVSVAELSEVDPAGFARALAPRRLHFPEDAGPHPDFRSEWWYYTGNLATLAGRRFGFELTFFRFALAAHAKPRRSEWASRQVYMAHLALTDVAAGRFHQSERLSRAALGLAGATSVPFHVWLGDWEAAGPGDEGSDGGGRGEGLFPLRLRADAPDFGISLRLEGGKPRVLNGERGLSRKSAAPGNASYYYSRTRMPVQGHVRAGGAQYAVTGGAWFDREWSTSALAPDQVGWDWFGLQLGDGRELMYYRLRRRDGSTDPFSAGTLVDRDGRTRPLARGDVELRVLDSWTSPHTGTRYPSRWKLRVAAAGIDLEVLPRLADQEIRGTVRYWEGAVSVRGTDRDRPVAGEGYVELAGYGSPAPEAGM